MTESTDATVLAEPIAERMSWRDRVGRAMGGEAWTIGLAVAFIALFVMATIFLILGIGAAARVYSVLQLPKGSMMTEPRRRQAQ